MQTAKESAIEIVIDTFIGFIGAWFITFFILHADLSPAMLSTYTVLACTVFSLIRKYVVRRWFNNRLAKRQS